MNESDCTITTTTLRISYNLYTLNIHLERDIFFIVTTSVRGVVRLTGRSVWLWEYSVVHKRESEEGMALHGAHWESGRILVLEGVF